MWPMTIEAYEKHFRGKKVPPTLVKLIEWKATQPREFYTRAFELQEDMGHFLEKLVLGKDYDKVIPFARADYASDTYFFWDKEGGGNLEECPILFSADDTGCTVIAKNIREFLVYGLHNSQPALYEMAVQELKQPAEDGWFHPQPILEALDPDLRDDEKLVIAGFYPEDDDDEENGLPRPLAGAYRIFLSDVLGLKLPAKDEVLEFCRKSAAEAQALWGLSFKAWNTPFIDKEDELFNQFASRWHQPDEIDPEIDYRLVNIYMRAHVKFLENPALEPADGLEGDRFPATLDIQASPEMPGVYTFTVFSMPHPSLAGLQKQLAEQPKKAELISYQEQTGVGSFKLFGTDGYLLGRVKLEGVDLDG